MACGTAYGSNAELFVVGESTFGEYVAIAGTQAIGHIESDITPTQEWIESEEHVGNSASLQTEIESTRGGTWSIKTYFKREAAGTAPENAALWASGLNGTAVTVGGTSVTYPLSSTEDPVSLQIVRYIGDKWCEWVQGACVETITIEQDGNNPPTATFAGSFKSYGFIKGDVQHTDTIATSDTTCDLATADAYKVRVGAVIQFGADDNGGAGYRVTAIDSDGDQLTFTPGLAGAGQTASTITPLVATGSYSGTVVNGIASGLSFDAGATEVGFISGSVEITTGLGLLSGEGSTAEPSCIAFRTARRVTCDFNFFFKDENASEGSRGWYGVGRDVHWRIGDGTVVNFTCDMPNVRFSPPEETVPQFEEVTYTISGKARQSAASDDEFQLVVAV